MRWLLCIALLAAVLGAPAPADAQDAGADSTTVTPPQRPRPVASAPT
jgi:hypothetical protein